MLYKHGNLFDLVMYLNKNHMQTGNLTNVFSRVPFVIHTRKYKDNLLHYFRSVHELIPLITDGNMKCYQFLSLSLIFFLTIPSVFSFQRREHEESSARHKRSVILLPANTSITITFDLSMPVRALAQQAAFYNMRVPFRFFIPTYDQLTSFYGRTESREDEDNNEIEQIHRQEQERANEERRYIYKNMESLLSR